MTNQIVIILQRSARRNDSIGFLNCYRVASFETDSAYTVHSEFIKGNSELNYARVDTRTHEDKCI